VQIDVSTNKIQENKNKYVSTFLEIIDGCLSWDFCNNKFEKKVAVQRFLS
jgi:hypothetical protein